jgi:hypothetical protein
MSLLNRILNERHVELTNAELGKRYDYWNARLFGNNLPKIPVVWARLPDNIAAKTDYDWKREPHGPMWWQDDEGYYHNLAATNINIQFNDRIIKRPLEQLDGVLIHEMVHVELFANGVFNDTNTGHPREFFDRLNAIQQKVPFPIPFQEFVVHDGELVETVLNEQYVDPSTFDIQELFDHFNVTLFDDRLPRISTEWTNQLPKTQAAFTNVTIESNDENPVEIDEQGFCHNYHVIGIEILISSRYKRTEDSLSGLLVHEMIHADLLYSGVAHSAGEYHGRYFMQRLRQIQAKCPFNIPMTENLSDLVTETVLAENADYDLKAKYDHFNKLLFNGELPDIPIRWKTLKGVGGHVQAKVVSPPGWKRPDPMMVRLGRADKYEGCHIQDGTHVMEISNLYKRDETALDGIMVHEMIHVYFNHIGAFSEQHGIKFLTKRRELQDKVSFPIPVTDKTEGLEFADEVKAKPYGVVLIQNKDGGYRVAYVTAKVMQDGAAAAKERWDSMVRYNYAVRATGYLVSSQKASEYAMQTKVQRKLGSDTAYYPLKDQSLIADLEQNGKVMFDCTKSG